MSNQATKESMSIKITFQFENGTQTRDICGTEAILVADDGLPNDVASHIPIKASWEPWARLHITKQDGGLRLINETADPEIQFHNEMIKSAWIPSGAAISIGTLQVQFETEPELKIEVAPAEVEELEKLTVPELLRQIDGIKPAPALVTPQKKRDYRPLILGLVAAFAFGTLLVIGTLVAK